MRTWIKSPLAVFSDSPAAGGIVVQDNLISELIGSNQHPLVPVDATLDASNLVMLPGLINTHHHYYQTLTRALPRALNKALFPWLQSLYPVWAGLENQMIEVATELACAEMLLSGCTTSADHHYLFPQASLDAIDAQIEAVRRIGIRSVLTRGSMSLGQDQGGLPPQSTVQQEDVIMADCERVVKLFHDPAPGSMVQIALAPCSPFSVSTELMQQTAEFCAEHQVRLHTHLAETEDETAFCLRQYGARPLDYLEQVGWLNDMVWLAHGIHFNQSEIDRLGAAKVGISHCPSSNMILGSGHCRTLELEHSGCPLGLGLDGSASNDGSNMIQEVRQALLLQRLHYGSDRVSHHDVLGWATSGSANCLGRQDIGMIAPGMQADIALFKLNEARFSGAGDPLAALVLCGAHRAHSVMVGGKWRVRDGELLGVDMEALLARHTVAARKLQGVAC